MERTHRCDAPWDYEISLDGAFEMYKVETDVQAADIFTKPFKGVKRRAAVHDLVPVADAKGFWWCWSPCPGDPLSRSRSGD
eukprot:10037209-Alexandrium_andersonii.AAC.1